MKTITIYDDTAELLEKLAEKYDSTEYDVLDDILRQMDEEDFDSMLK